MLSLRWVWAVALASVLIAQIGLLAAQIDPVYAHADPAITIPILPSGPCVHGSFDKVEWRDASRIRLETGSDFYVESTENRLLFALFVPADRTIDERDGMWLYLDTKHDGGTGQKNNGNNNNDWRFWMGRDSIAEVWNFRNGEWETRGDPFWFSWRVRSYSDGWMLEACARLANDVKDGSVVGIMIRHDDYGTGSNLSSGVFPAKAVHDDPDSWGDAKFASLI